MKSEVTAQSNTVGRLRFFLGGEMLEKIRVADKLQALVLCCSSSNGLRQLLSFVFLSDSKIWVRLKMYSSTYGLKLAEFENLRGLLANTASL